MPNKGEAVNSVGRLMFFGKHGRLIEKQLEKASFEYTLIFAYNMEFKIS